MKYLLIAYKLPFTIEELEIAVNYRFIQSLLSYNAASDSPVYEVTEKTIRNNGRK